MLELFVYLSRCAVVCTGLYVLTKGDWRKFGLKFAGVGISTMAAIYVLVSAALINGLEYCAASAASHVCLTFEIYSIARNIAFVIFHVAVGRDAIHYKQRDRRGTPCQKNLLKQSHP